MGEDRSLDEFFDVSDDGTERDDEEAAADAETGTDIDESDSGRVDEGDDTTETTEAEATEPTTAADETHAVEAADLPHATYRWSPDGDDCPRCGTRVEQQWRDGDQFVCVDCKEW